MAIYESQNKAQADFQQPGRYWQTILTAYVAQIKGNQGIDASDKYIRKTCVLAIYRWAVVAVTWNSGIPFTNSDEKHYNERNESAYI